MRSERPCEGARWFGGGSVVVDRNALRLRWLCDLRQFPRQTFCPLRPGGFLSHRGGPTNGYSMTSWRNIGASSGRRTNGGPIVVNLACFNWGSSA